MPNFWEPLKKKKEFFLWKQCMVTGFCKFIKFIVPMCGFQLRIALKSCSKVSVDSYTAEKHPLHLACVVLFKFGWLNPITVRLTWCFSVSQVLLDDVAWHTLWQEAENRGEGYSVSGIPCSCPFAPVEHCVLLWNSNEALLMRDKGKHIWGKGNRFDSIIILKLHKQPFADRCHDAHTSLSSFYGSSWPHWFILGEEAPINKQQTFQHRFHIWKCYFICQGICLEKKDKF